MIRYEVEPSVSDDELNALFAAAWDPGLPARFGLIHSRSLTYICAYVEDRLIGYVNVAWDGGIHAFLLEPTVHTEFQRHGIGTEIVRRALQIARDRGARWMHVDFEEELRTFYDRCGFRETPAGLIDLTATEPRTRAAARRSP